MIERSSTRFYITQADYQGLLLDSSASLMIITIPKRNNHPKGRYIIPNRDARTFIESKQGTHNWDSNNNFIQDSIPSGLEKYFTSI